MRRDVLLLQGPIGPFFSRFAGELENRGFVVHKVNFNGGDRTFYKRPGAMDFADGPDEWEAFLERLIINREIGRIYLFGDCRRYHRVARAVAERHQIRVFVFEEGYIRPNFITIEEGGVNGNSPMMRRDFKVRKSYAKPLDEQPHPKHVFAITALYSIIYYLSSALMNARYPKYVHHRDFRCLSEAWRWIVSGLRKVRFGHNERHVMAELLPQFEKNYFVVPLQVHCDMQVVVHSPYNSIEHFIGEVMVSFARHAPKNKALVFKHHPLDRGYTDYSRLLMNLQSELGLQGRVYYVHDVCLPTLLKHAQGTLLINSTVGMSSLFHGTPVKTLGQAIYDIQGLTCQRSLKSFWNTRLRVDADLFNSFRLYLMTRNQLNGNLYRTIGSGDSSGLLWPAALSEEHTFDADRTEFTLYPQLTVVAGRGPQSDSKPAFGDDAEAA